MKLSVITATSCAWCASATLLCAQQPAPTNAPPASPPWDVSAAAGLTLTRGNSRTVVATANVAADKKWDLGKNELALGADGVYGENNGVKNAEQEHGFAQFNHLFTERFLGYARVEGLHDAIADIDYRLSLGPGVGYYLVKTTNTTFRVEAGGAYINEHDSPGGNRSYIALRVAERFEQKISSVAKVWEQVELLPQVDKFSNYILNSEVGVESAMSKKLSLLAYIRDSYHSDPAPGRLKNDVMLVTAIKCKF
jgi:putative salt-induced outer membrane protein